ncbi:phosphatidylinositol N-acetylglucosaminyltransferase subunit C [Nothobranchius furzeri]|uniref:Phosphatidylinositol glycan anchor biosynthesis, class C n=4 Tax=Nothobranchius TaxID=28779 RepID=A0A8C6PMD6_NOTFU|nr:phosphatidylinositol N-acetylglucosaminyltransferase subunit C [Nothobranchius furzeri]XP_015827291.1 phosphatidylinositol N-acetylglucosaminyltransferase subunit C [Nothobranchius furzeri]XP_015827292.1 phosphatidylinositol N-acetylglucosaminyltransferase subunit C [Nothobranchius furzeri]KAF7203355.1 transcript variant X3 [Nothobranchius furzeri]KAF7203356.1 transcript variant X4 [Nothobranchius furzeri]KAF7203357.1 transcript variant X1 [Nothobranchius furzeri]KAF7203358.1 transcript va
MGADGAPSQSVPWRKVLWERQPFPDNYVDQRFLEELRRNEGIREYRYWAVVKEASLVGQQLSCVAIFITFWLYMEQGLLAPETLLWTSLVCGLLGYGLYQAFTSQTDSCSETRTHLADLQSAALFLSFTFGFSPVLKTLTESVSTDTVYAMSAVMLLAHLVSFPYGEPSPPGSLSLNAALFASVCLASRLPGALHTFAMLSCALLVFALWPCLLQRLRENSPLQFTGVCVGVCTGGVGGLASQSLGGAVLLSLAVVSVTFLCPLLLVWLQRHKDNIHGPWDEAEICEDLSHFLH